LGGEAPHPRKDKLEKALLLKQRLKASEPLSQEKKKSVLLSLLLSLATPL